MPFVTLSTATVYAHEYGGEGAPVVALHGLGGNHLNWMAVADGLRRWGRVIAPDLPGFGYSPPAGSYAVGAHVTVAIQFLERQASPSLLLGNSLGGLVAMRVAAERPDLVNRLVLVSPAGPPRPFDPSIDRQVAKRLVLQGLPLFGPAVVRSYVRRYTPRQVALDTLRVVCHRPDRVPAAVLQRSLELAHVRRSQPWAVEALVRSGRSAGVALVDRPGFTRMVRAIRAPTLLIQGAHDRVIPGSAIDRMAGLRPDWCRVTVEAGHCSQLEQPEEFVRLLADWIDRPVSATG